MLNRIRSIESIYDIKEISNSGYITIKDKKVHIYKIEPANIVACDEETKFKIYKAYLTCIRGLPSTFQILISKEKADFKEQIESCTNRLEKVQNEGLRLALKRYIEYLEEIAKLSNLYKSTHYLIVEQADELNEADLSNIFTNLNEFGVGISKVTSRKEIESILRKFILKKVDKDNGFSSTVSF